MSLATIFVVCLLWALPSIIAASSSAVPRISEANRSTADSAQTSAPPEAATPSQQSKPESTAAPPPASAPATQSPHSDSNVKKPAGPATKKQQRKHKPVVQPVSPSPKTVVPNGSTTDPKTQIAPSVTDAQASRQRQSTTQLLASTDANLKRLSGRQLTPSQQDTMKQIQAYMEQAKTADTAGDLQSAHNLAVKAQLLSDELVKH